MKNQRKVKLQLSRETMRVLASKELASIVGGCGCHKNQDLPSVHNTDCSDCGSCLC